MKHITTLILLLAGFVATAQPKHGDVVFANYPPPIINPETGQPVGTFGPMLQTIFNATYGPETGWYTHCGIVVEESGQLYVLEAEAKVQMQDWEVWQAKVGGVYDTYEFIWQDWFPVLTDLMIAKMLKYEGLPYDFAWLKGNKLQSCAELINTGFLDLFGFDLVCWERLSDLAIDQPVDAYTAAVFGLPPWMTYEQLLSALGHDTNKYVLSPPRLAAAWCLVRVWR